MSYDYAFTLPRWASGRSNDVFNDDGANTSAVSGLTSNVTTGTSYSDVVSSGSGRNVGSTRSILDQQSIAGSDTRSNKFDQIMEMDDDFDLYLLRARNRLCSGKFLFKCTLCMGVLCFIVGVSTLNWASTKHEDAIMQSQTNRNKNNDNNSMSEAALSSMSSSSSTATIMTMTLPSPPYDLTDKCSYESIHTREGLAACEMICGPATHCCLSKDNQECFEKHIEECNIYSESCQIINITNDVYSNDSSSSSIVSAEVGSFPWDGTKDDENEATTTASKVEKNSAANTAELLHSLDDACYFQQDLSDCTELCDVGRCCFISLTLGEDKCTNDGIVLPITCEQYYEPCSVLSQFYDVDSDDEDIIISKEEEKQESLSSSLTTDLEEESTDAAATVSAASASEYALLIAPANLDDICSMEDLSECMELCDTAARCCFEPLVECSPSLGYTDDVCNIYRPCSVLDIYDDEWNLSHIGASATRSTENVDDEIRVNY